MSRIHSYLLCCLTAVFSLLFSGSVYAQLSDVTQPGDPIIASSSRSPGSEGVANAIDNQPTKYLNFDSGQNGFIPSGFVVSPAVGNTHVTGIALMSANDAPERDPRAFTLEGSNDETIGAFNSGNWTLIATISGIPTWESIFGGGNTNRFKTQTFNFPNRKAYRHYRWIVTETQTTPNGCCMQIAEVEFLGKTLPRDVTQPGDTIFASSSRSPGSEGVANAIDNQPTKYLNFDSGQNGFIPSGFAVSPSIGRTLVNAISMQSANDAIERDPKTVTLEGSNDPTLTGYNSGTWEPITTISNIPDWPSIFGGGNTNRFKTQTFFFDNPKPYRHYRWVVSETQTTPNGCCMQIAEVELLGTSAPRDVTQPGDPIFASSSRSPGSEGVANAIDDQPTKYLNFDSGQNGFLPSGFAVSPRIGATTIIGLTMQSANDAPERDPRAITLEGSNDDTLSGFNSGTWELITAISGIPTWESIFGGGNTNRFKTQEFFFSNTKSYKHYRWIVTETQTTPNGCCMQIAEVEFLAVPQAGNTNVIDTLIRRQPTDTPVLLGAQATFRVLLTGPWNVQWHKNGVPIPGAIAPSYTTPAATAADDGALYKAVVSSPQGTQVSDEVMLSIFTPSGTQSIGWSFEGSGANGAPTALLPTDITGFHPQAYWNNITEPSGVPTTATTSDNTPHPSVAISWATSGEWGAGTGTSDPTERLFNGIATIAGTTEATAQSVTFSGVPAGNHSVFIYTVQVPLEFFNLDFAVTSGGTTQRRYIRPLNSDEYNPLPGFSLVTSDTAASRGVGNFMRFDNVSPGADGNIQITFFSPGRVDLPGGDPIRGPGINGLQLVLNPAPVGDPPVITQQPVSANGIAGGCITLTVEATGPGLTYQWLRNGQEIAGATGASLTLTSLTTNSAGSYSVVISNPAGRSRSRNAVVQVLASPQIGTGLITYYKFDEVDGRIAANSAAGGQNADLVEGFELWEPGQVANSLTFEGNIYALAPNYPKVSGAMTVVSWVKSTIPAWGPIVNNWVEGQLTGSSGQFTLDVFDDAGVPTVRGQIEVGPNRVLATAPIDGTLNVWHHVAMTANGGTLSLYWDGRLVATADYLGSINATPSIPWLAIAVDPLAAGGALDPLGRYLTGGLDDLAIWNRSLSEVEVSGIYNGGLSGQSIAQIPPVLIAGDCRPTIQCPNNITAECTGGQTPITFTATGADASGNPLTATCVPPSGSSFSVGQTTVTCTVTSSGVSASCSFRVTVTDTVPPTLTCPANITADATSPAGAVVNYIASATDPCGIASFECLPAPGSTFPIGLTAVACSSVDSAGNSNRCSFSITVREVSTNRPPVAVINSEQLIDLSPEFDNPVLLSCNWWNACLVADGWTSSDPEGGDLTYLWTLGLDPVPFGAGPVVTNCLEVGIHTINLTVTDPEGLTGTTSKTIEVVTAPLAIELLIEQINESHKSGVVLTRKTKRELTETLRVALRFAGEEKLRETQKALDAFEKKVRAQVVPTEPEAARVWILWSQAVSQGMEKCIKPPRKSKDHHDDKKDDDKKKDDPR